MISGNRIIKTTVAIFIALFISDLLQLEYYTSAAIITALGIQSSIKQTYTIALKRLCSCLIALCLSFLFFYLFDFKMYVFIPILLIFLPILIRFRMQEGLGPSMVIVMHIFLYEHTNLFIFFNELKIIGVGLGISMLTNIYFSSHTKTIEVLKLEIETHMSSILKQYGQFLTKGDTTWEGNEFIVLPIILDRSKQLAMLEVENQWITKNLRHLDYFIMREKQLRILERLAPIIALSNPDIQQSKMYGEYFKKISDFVNDQPNNYLEDLLQIRNSNKEMPLPLSREEFEYRANLYYIANELENFLSLKKAFSAHL